MFVKPKPQLGSEKIGAIQASDCACVKPNDVSGSCFLRTQCNFIIS
jgi:hypothetical protein